MDRVRESLEQVIPLYPERAVRQIRHELDRFAFDVGLAWKFAGPNGRVLDLGGGVSPFAPACAALGMEATVVDHFQGPFPGTVERLTAAHRRFGAQVVEADIIGDGIDAVQGDFDLVGCFETMEHFHHSPKALFRHVADDRLTSAGAFVVSTPNAANLRKRITVPLGRAKWSSMEIWYERERFYGHVREPDVDDLGYVARDLGLVDYEILGRNFLGKRSAYRFARIGARLGDPILRRFPSLCSNLYLIARKGPGAERDQDGACLPRGSNPEPMD